MRKWTKEEISFLRKNFQKLSYIEISKILNRPLQGVYRKAFDLGIKKGRWNEENKLNREKVVKLLLKQKNKLRRSPSLRDVPISLRSACQRHFGNFNNAKRKANLKIREKIRILPPNSYSSSKELAYVVGLILGDGSFRHQKSRERTSYVIVYATKDKELMDFFLKNFGNWAGFKPKKISIVKEKIKKFPNGKNYYCKKVYLVQIPSKNTWIFLKEFKDKPEKCLIFFRRNHQNWLLKGLWDAEGCIRAQNSKYLRIHFSNSNKNIINLYTKLLENFNFKYAIHKTSKGFNIDILSKQSMIKFIKLIGGITINRKLNKNIQKILEDGSN